MLSVPANTNSQAQDALIRMQRLALARTQTQVGFYARAVCVCVCVFVLCVCVYRLGIREVDVLYFWPTNIDPALARALLARNFSATSPGVIMQVSSAHARPGLVVT